MSANSTCSTFFRGWCMVIIMVSQAYYWASEASPTLDCSIKILGDICRYICRYICLDVCRYVYDDLWETHTKKSYAKYVGEITWFKHMHAQTQFLEFETKCHLETLIVPSSGRLKTTCDTRIIHFYSTLEQLSWTQKKPKIKTFT